MGLAGEDELHRHLRIVDQRGERLEVLQQQVGPLVGGEPAGEADRQRVEAERAAQLRDDRRPARRGVPPAAPRAAGRSRSAAPSASGASPTARRRRRSRWRPRDPAACCAPPSRRRGAGRRPGASAARASVDVHAVGDVADRHFVLAQARIERHPHRARDVAVQRRHGVGAAGRLSASTVMQNCSFVVVRIDAAEAPSRRRTTGRARRAAGRGAPRPARRETGRGRPAPACAW